MLCQHSFWKALHPEPALRRMFREKVMSVTACHFRLIYLWMLPAQRKDLFLQNTAHLSNYC